MNKMILEKIDKTISSRVTKQLLILSVILLIIVYPIMGYFFLISGSPSNIMESQLSFSAEYMKDYYSSIDDLSLYGIAETLDYGFMISYGLLSFSLALIISRRFEEGSKMRTIGMSMAILAIFAAGFDAIENIFILLMVSDPVGFPSFFALAHSTFALVKWIILMSLIIWAILAVVISLLKK